MSCEIVASFCYIAGDSVLLQFSVVDADGDPANLTGTTVRFAMSRRRGGAAVIGTEESPPTATVTVTDLTGGIFEVAIDPSDTAGLRGMYHFESELEDVSGDIATVGRGLITFTSGLV